jgi:hypothetical protein
VLDGAFKAFDPTLAATNGGQTKATGAGGGLIAGAGTYYSLPTETGPLRTECSDIIDLTGGSLAGTIVRQVANDRREEDDDSTAQWVDFTDSPALPAISGAARFGTSAALRYNRYRFKVVITAGSGTIEDRRLVKGKQ